MHAHHLLHRYGKHAERIVIAQILLGGAREFFDVLQFFEVIRVNARFIEFAAIHRHIFVGVIESPLQALRLQCLQLVQRCFFDWVQLCICCHYRVLAGKN